MFMMRRALSMVNRRHEIEIPHWKSLNFTDLEQLSVTNSLSWSVFMKKYSAVAEIVRSAMPTPKLVSEKDAIVNPADISCFTKPYTSPIAVLRKKTKADMYQNTSHLLPSISSKPHALPKPSSARSGTSAKRNFGILLMQPFFARPSLGAWYLVKSMLWLTGGTLRLGVNA